jgi:hypothetical protein
MVEYRKVGVYMISFFRVGKKVECIKDTVLNGVSVDKKHPMRGEIIQVTKKKIGNNYVYMCLFCPETQEDKHKGFEISSKWLNFIKE